MAGIDLAFHMRATLVQAMSTEVPPNFITMRAMEAICLDTAGKTRKLRLKRLPGGGANARVPAKSAASQTNG